MYPQKCNRHIFGNHRIILSRSKFRKAFQQGCAGLSLTDPLRIVFFLKPTVSDLGQTKSFRGQTRHVSIHKCILGLYSMFPPISVHLASQDPQCNSQQQVAQIFSVPQESALTQFSQLLVTKNCVKDKIRILVSTVSLHED